MSTSLYQEGLVFNLVLGEEYDPIEIQLVDEENALLSLANVDNIYFQMYYDKAGRKVALEKTGADVTKDEVSSVLSCQLDADDTENLDPGDYFARFKFTDGSGDLVRYSPQAGSFIQMRLIS